MSNKLTNSGLTIVDVVRLSREYYKSDNGDDKAKRSKIDVKSAKLKKRNNLEYNHSTKTWEQTGRDVLFTFMVRSVPTSYKRTDSISQHYYPVYILLHKYEKGLESTFRWRTGSLKKPLFAKKGDSKSKRTQIANKNILNMVQLNFFFFLEYLLRANNLLYGRCYATRPPIKTNPKNKIFLDKTAWHVVNKLLSPLFANSDFKVNLNKVMMNK